MSEIQEFEEFHPRAVKLLRKKKPFIVIAIDEPYYLQAFALIRQHEQQKGTWSVQDELCYQRDAAEPHVERTEPGLTVTEDSTIDKAWPRCPFCGTSLIMGNIRRWYCPDSDCAAKLGVAD